MLFKNAKVHDSPITVAADDHFTLLEVKYNDTACMNDLLLKKKGLKFPVIETVSRRFFL